MQRGRQPHVLLVHRDGKPEVNQRPVGDFDISWNPDDDRFYVHARDADSTVLRTYGGPSGLRNARQFAREETRRKADLEEMAS